MLETVNTKGIRNVQWTFTNVQHGKGIEQRFDSVHLWLSMYTKCYPNKLVLTTYSVQLDFLSMNNKEMVSVQVEHQCRGAYMSLLGRVFSGSVVGCLPLNITFCRMYMNIRVWDHIYKVQTSAKNVHSVLTSQMWWNQKHC